MTNIIILGERCFVLALPDDELEDWTKIVKRVDGSIADVLECMLKRALEGLKTSLEQETESNDLESKDERLGRR